MPRRTWTRWRPIWCGGIGPQRKSPSRAASNGQPTPSRRAALSMMRSAFRCAGADPIDMGMGGSILFIAEFAAAFPQATILAHRGRPGTQAHSVNESLHLRWDAQTAEARCCCRGYTDRSRRSLATWPVALTLYCATTIFPSSSTTGPITPAPPSCRHTSVSPRRHL